MERQLEKIYNDPKNPNAFTSVVQLHRATGFKKSDIRNWLEKQEAYTLHKPARVRFPRRQIVVNGPNHQWQMDLADMRNLDKDNDGMKYLLTCVDCFSRFAWVQPVKSKSGKDVTSAAKKIFNSADVLPQRIQTDKGLEFYNTPFKKLLKDHGVELFSTHNVEIKAAMVERFNRTLKNRLYKYMTANYTDRYVDVLQDIVNGYNNSYHRTIKMKPIEVIAGNKDKVWHTLYQSKGYSIKKKPKFKVGDTVRIVKEKKLFTRGYLPRWTTEYFAIHSVLKTTPTTYRIKDLLDEVLEGSFYEQELQRIPVPTGMFRVEKVIKEDKKNKNRLFVKWYGWDNRFNSWIDKKNLRK